MKLVVFSDYNRVGPIDKIISLYKEGTVTQTPTTKSDSLKIYFFQ